MTNEKTEVQAIVDDAVAGGFLYKGHKPHIEQGNDGQFRVSLPTGGYEIVPIEVFLMMPQFWEAVGKTRGWGTEMVLIDEPGHPKEWCYFEHCDRCGAVINDQEDGCPDGCRSDNAYVPSWLYEQHRFIDHLADGDDIDTALGKLQ